MKKIIYIANVRLPTEKAHGIQIMKMCEAFSNQGLKVELIIPWRFNKIKENAFNYYGVKENFKIKRIFSLDLIFLNIPKICFWLQSLTFSIFVFFYLLFKKANIIYSRDSFPLYLLSFFKKNLIHEVHTFPKNFFLHKRVLRKSNKIIVITRILKNTLINKGILENKILVAPDGVNLEEFDIKISKEQAREKLSLPLDKKIVLYTGHLYKWKGSQILANASKFLDEDMLVIFVGGTEKDIKYFKSQVLDFKLKNVLIVGHRPYSEIPYWLKSADVLVLPNSGKAEISRNWTSPMKMFEYMAVKRPIVASDLPCLREVLNQNNAILVVPDDSQRLARGIKQVLKNPDFSAKISRQAYNDVQKYTWQKRVGNILKYIS